MLHTLTNTDDLTASFVLMMCLVCTDNVLDPHCTPSAVIHLLYTINDKYGVVSYSSTEYRFQSCYSRARRYVWHIPIILYLSSPPPPPPPPGDWCEGQRSKLETANCMKFGILTTSENKTWRNFSNICFVSMVTCFLWRRHSAVTIDVEYYTLFSNVVCISSFYLSNPREIMRRIR